MKKKKDWKKKYAEWKGWCSFDDTPVPLDFSLWSLSWRLPPILHPASICSFLRMLPGASGKKSVCGSDGPFVCQRPFGQQTYCVPVSLPCLSQLMPTPNLGSLDKYLISQWKKIHTFYFEEIIFYLLDVYMYSFTQGIVNKYITHSLGF